MSEGEVILWTMPDTTKTLTSADRKKWSALEKKETDPAAIEEIRQRFYDLETWERAGDLARQVRFNWIKRISRGTPAVKSTVTAKMESLRREIAGKDPSPLESLLVERVLVCWLQVHDADLHLATAGMLSTARYWADQVDRAQRRYESAIRSLAQIRRLGVPGLVQVNIGAQQVNVAQHSAQK